MLVLLRARPLLLMATGGLISALSYAPVSGSHMFAPSVEFGSEALTQPEFGGVNGTPLAVSAPGSLAVGVASDLPIPDPSQANLIDPPNAPESIPVPLLDVERLTSPLSEYELRVRQDSGFAELTVEELAADAAAASESVAATGVRMTKSELEEFKARQDVAVSASLIVGTAERLPEYAGMYMNNSVGMIVIQSNGRTDRLLELASKNLQPDRFMVEEVQFSHEQLRAVAQTIVPTDATGNVVVQAVDPIFAKYLQYMSVAIRYPENAVFVLIDDIVPAEVKIEIERRLGDRGKTMWMSAELRNEQCVLQYCAPAIRPGQGIRFTSNNAAGAASCTAGGGYYVPGTNIAYVSSAGHCSDSQGAVADLISSWDDNMPGIGGPAPTFRTAYSTTNLVRSHVAGNFDAALARMPIGMVGNVAYAGSALTGKFAIGSIVQGTNMTAVGAASNGALVNQFWAHTTIGDRVAGQMRWDVMTFGDSGGPVFVGSTYAGHHITERTINLGDGQGAISREVFEAVTTVESRFGVTFKNFDRPPQRLTNTVFSGLGGWNAANWAGGGVAWGQVTGIGHVNENSINGWCTGATPCSYFQDVAKSVTPSTNITAGSWVYCQSNAPCSVTLAVWGLTGGPPPANINRSATISPNTGVYIAFDGSLPYSYTGLRFELYFSTGVVWITSPRLYVS